MNWKTKYLSFWKKHLWMSASIHLIIFLLLFSDFIIGNKPIVCSYKSEIYCFLWQENSQGQGELYYDLNQIAQGNFRNLNYDFSLWPLIYRDAQKTELESAWQKPGTRMKDGTRYLIGSYDLGKDLLIACLVGFKKSLLLALMTLFISILPSLLLGSLLVFHSIRYQYLSLVSILCSLFSLICFIYIVATCLEWMTISTSAIVIFFIAILFIFLAIRLRNLKPQFRFLLDSWSLRYLEIMKSIPVLLILLILLQIIQQPNRIQFATMLAFIFIPYLVKYARAFTLKAVNENFITASIILGQSGWQVYFKHIVPKLIQDMIPILAFGMANIILLEASLSFIGIGFALDEISLGGLLFNARSNPGAWWVIVFPGLLIFWIVALLNQFGNIFSKDLIPDNS